MTHNRDGSEKTSGRFFGSTYVPAERDAKGKSVQMSKAISERCKRELDAGTNALENDRKRLRQAKVDEIGGHPLSLTFGLGCDSTVKSVGLIQEDPELSSSYPNVKGIMFPASKLRNVATASGMNENCQTSNYLSVMTSYRVDFSKALHNGVETYFIRGDALVRGNEKAIAKMTTRFGNFKMCKWPEAIPLQRDLVCSAAGCENACLCKGLCLTHYNAAARALRKGKH